MSGRHRALLSGEHPEIAWTSEQYRSPSYPSRIVRALVQPQSLRAHLSRILLVAVFLVLAMLAFIVSERLTIYRSAAETSRVVTVALKVQDLLHEVQRERGMTYGLLDGGTFYGPALDAQRMRTNIARADLNNILNDPDYAGQAVNDVRSALGKLKNLPDMRKQVDGGHAQPADIFSYYTTANRALTDLQLGLDRAGDPQLRNGLQALYALSDVKDYADWTRGLLNGVFTADSISPAQYTQLAQVRADQLSAHQIYDHFATPDQQRAVTAVFHSPVATTAARVEDIAFAAVDGKLGQHVDAQVNWWNQMTLLINSLREVQQDPVSADIITRTEQLRSSALDQLILFLVVAALAISVVVALIVGAARSVIGPLQFLAAEADTVATERLPAAVAAIEHAAQPEEAHRLRDIPLEIPAKASSEIRLVAQAVGRLHNTALSLASEQAMIRRNTTTSLANLGRRNQNLVRRQLSLISEFEREELDPTMLANMFKLDHLATRMRRNAESLLVLAGESSPRSWTKLHPLVDVVRAALSEVEDYRRVDLKRIDEVNLSGSTATDLAHILAELIENGLSFSPPDAEVEVSGRRMGGRYVIAVVDHGTGLDPDALNRANGRLHGDETFLVAPTRFLGHYVVGALAKRLDIDVSLTPAPVTGITATLALPESILVWPNDRPVSRSNPSARFVDQPAMEVRFPQGVIPSSRETSNNERLRQPTEPGPAAEEAAATRESAQSSDLASAVRPERPIKPRVHVDQIAERTRNGLVKRQSLLESPRQSKPQPIPAGAGQPRERTPGEVSSMLSSYRSGHQRGIDEGVGATNEVRPAGDDSKATSTDYRRKT